jgi:hypothetical protein
MTTFNVRYVAVLTGDLIGSTSAGANAVTNAFEVIRSCAAEISQWMTPALDLRFTRSRGDGWQIVLTEPRFALRAALFIFARLKVTSPDLQTRIAIGIGEITTLGSGDTDRTGNRQPS